MSSPSTRNYIKVQDWSNELDELSLVKKHSSVIHSSVSSYQPSNVTGLALALGLLLAIFYITTGLLNLNNCQIDNRLPIIVVVFGLILLVSLVFLVAILAFRMLCVKAIQDIPASHVIKPAHEKSLCSQCFTIVFEIFILTCFIVSIISVGVLSIISSISIFRIRSLVTFADANSATYCHPVFYYFFFVNLVVFILVLLIILFTILRISLSTARGRHHHNHHHHNHKHLDSTSSSTCHLCTNLDDPTSHCCSCRGGNPYSKI